jgi:tetratricopeptide (TPR) repeat protein
MEDIFGLQDELVEKVMQSLAVPLGEQEDLQKRQDVPANGQAYEAYLRANDMVGRRQSRSVLQAARALYQECLEADPSFAPAWSRLGRTERLLAKYGHGDASMHRQLAESAFEKALEINPNLPLTHNLVTYFELEEQQDAIGAMGRLLGRVAQTPDPNLYAGLVTACRFCGLYEASIEANRRAKRLDPQILTSIAYTHYMRGDYERSIETDTGSLPFVKFFTMARLGQSREAVKALERAGILDQQGLESTLAQLAHAAFQDRVEETRRLAKVVLESDFQDPEGLYFVALHLAVVGELEQAAAAFDRIVGSGFYCYLPLSSDPVLADRFDVVIETARRGVEKARWRFRTEGGESILGVSEDSSFADSPSS